MEMELEQEAKVKAALLKSDQKKPTRVSLSPSPLPSLPPTPLVSLSRSLSLFHCLTVVRICKITTAATFTTPALSLSIRTLFFIRFFFLRCSHRRLRTASRSKRLRLVLLLVLCLQRTSLSRMANDGTCVCIWVYM